MSNSSIRSRVEQLVRLEQRIRELGGTIPKRWPWDYDGSARNLQLIEEVERLECEQYGPGGATWLFVLIQRIREQTGVPYQTALVRARAIIAKNKEALQ